MTEWLDRLASDILIAETDLRSALRRITRPGALDAATHAGATHTRRITIGVHEARTLLRACMPVPIGTSRLRGPHAAMVARLTTFGAHLVAMNDAHHPPGAAIAAAADLVDSLRAWVAALRWSLACRAAKVKGWGSPRLDITTTLRRVTIEQTFPDEQLPSAERGRAANHTPATMQQLRAHRQLSLDLGSPAEIVDFRQLTLTLPERRHAAR